MAPPRGDMKKGKADLGPDRKQFKKHRKDGAAEQMDDSEQQQSSPVTVADDADFPRGKLRATLPFRVTWRVPIFPLRHAEMRLTCCAGGRSLLSRDKMAEARAEAESDFDNEGRKGKRKRKGS
jgi:rRNA biogenesis protein RRP5